MAQRKDVICTFTVIDDTYLCSIIRYLAELSYLLIVLFFRWKNVEIVKVLTIQRGK